MSAVKAAPNVTTNESQVPSEVHPKGSRLVGRVRSVTKLVTSKVEKLRKWLKEKAQRRPKTGIPPSIPSGRTSLPTAQMLNDSQPRSKHELEEKVLGNINSIPKVTQVQIDLGPEQEQEIRHRQIELLIKEELEEKTKLQATLKIIQDLFDQQNQMMKSEIERKKLLEQEHNKERRVVKKKIAQLQARSQSIERHIEEMEKKMTKDPSKTNEKILKSLRNDNNKLNKEIKEAMDLQDKACNDFEKVLEQREMRLRQQRNEYVNEIAKYKAAQNRLELSLEEKIVVRKALEDLCHAEGHTHGLSSENAESASSAPPTDEGTLKAEISEARKSLKGATTSSNGSTDEYVIRSGLERQTMVKDATFQIKGVFIKELIDESEISDIEGYVISSQKLGETAISTVYRARINLYHKEGKSVAARIIELQDPRFEKLFRKEGLKILSYVNKKPFESLVRVFDVMLVNDKCFIFEELVDKTLHAQIELEGAQSQREIHNYGQQIGYGLSYLHDIGVAHQNLNPSTIFRTTDRVLKIGCLEGSVLYYNPDTSKKIFRHRVRETTDMFFVSPEVKKEESYDPSKVDVYSFGLILLYMYFGLKPILTYPKKSTHALWRETNPKLDSLMSDEARKVIQNCLEIDPFARKSIRKVLVSTWLASEK